MIIFNYVLLSQSSFLSSFKQIVIKNLLSFNSTRKAVIVPARKSNNCSGIKRVIIMAIDLVYIISNESICAPVAYLPLSGPARIYRHGCTFQKPFLTGAQ